MTATIEYGTSPGLRADGDPARSVPVVVIGAGQAGLSAAYHLRRRGIDHVVLDGEDAPGGAWRHRWRSLRMATVNGIFDLPGMAQPPVDPDEPALGPRARSSTPPAPGRRRTGRGTPARRPSPAASCT